jgi:excisionase family DNA binding protein
MTIVEIIAGWKQALKIEELARLLNCSKGKLYKMVDTGRIPYMKLGSMIRFDPATTARWVADHMLTSI